MIYEHQCTYKAQLAQCAFSVVVRWGITQRAIRTVKKKDIEKNQMGGNGIFPVVPSIWVVQVQRPIMWKNENPYYSHKFILGCSISLVFSLLQRTSISSYVIFSVIFGPSFFVEKITPSTYSSKSPISLFLQKTKTKWLRILPI